MTKSIPTGVRTFRAGAGLSLHGRREGDVDLPQGRLEGEGGFLEQQFRELHLELVSVQHPLHPVQDQLVQLRGV